MRPVRKWVEEWSVWSCSEDRYCKDIKIEKKEVKTDIYRTRKTVPKKTSNDNL